MCIVDKSSALRVLADQMKNVKWYLELRKCSIIIFNMVPNAASSNLSDLIAYFGKKFNLLKPTGYVMHQQFNIQQLYVLPTPYLCVLYLSENKQRLVPLTA